MSHIEMFAEILYDAATPLDRQGIVDALDRRFPGWTAAATYAGKLGIVSRVIYKAPECYAEIFVAVPGGRRTRWTLSDTTRAAIGSSR